MKKCIRCQYKVSNKVYKYSKNVFGYVLCRNCQEWFLNNKLNEELKQQIIDKLIDNPDAKVNLPDYEYLISKYDSNVSFLLQNNNCSYENFKSNISVNSGALIKYNERYYKITYSDDSIVRGVEVSTVSKLDKIRSFHNSNGSSLFGKEAEMKSLNFDSNFIEYQNVILDLFLSNGYDLEKGDINEGNFKNLILDDLKEYFIIEKEVEGKHFSGRKMLIDAILIPKNRDDWRNKDLVFGIEFKHPFHIENTGSRYTDLLAQCLDYSFSTFKGFKDVIIFLCPLFPQIKDEKLMRFIARYNVGYIDFQYNGVISFYLGKGKPLFVNGSPTSVLKKSLLKQKYGNRNYKL